MSGTQDPVKIDPQAAEVLACMESDAILRASPFMLLVFPSFAVVDAGGR